MPANTNINYSPWSCFARKNPRFLPDFLSMRQGRQGNFFYFHVSFVIGSFRIERAIPTFSRSTCRPPGRWLNGSLDIDCRAGSGLSGASLNRGLSPAATIGRPPPADSPGVFVGLAIKRRVDCVRVKPRDIAKIYDRPSASGGLSRRIRWFDWRVEARSCSNHLFVGSSHPKPAYRIPDHRCAARRGVG